MPTATLVTSTDFWGNEPSQLVYRAYKPIHRGQMKRRRPNLLWPTFDRKVNPDGWYQVSRRRWVPELPNAFSLLAEETCPESTDYCESICYAKRMEKMQGVYEAYKHNTDLIRGASDDELVWLLSEMIGGYVYNALLKQLKKRDRIFRWHPSGDFDSVRYARMAGRVMAAYPGIIHYVYTRSFHGSVNVIPELIGVPNLALYISVDPDNVEPAREIFREYASQGLMIAPTARDYDTARKIHAEVVGAVPRRLKACPENNKDVAMGLMEDARGACVRCLWCPETKLDVMFAETGKEFADAPVRQLAMGEVRLAAPTFRRRPLAPPPISHPITEPVRFDTVEALELFLSDQQPAAGT